MNKQSTTKRRVKVTPAIRAAYRNRDKSLDNIDPNAPVRPPEFWVNAEVGKFYRPIKTAVSLRLDADVLNWLKTSGDRYQTRINSILRERMTQDLAG